MGGQAAPRFPLYCQCIRQKTTSHSNFFWGKPDDFLYIPAAGAFNLNHRVPQIGTEKQAAAFFATYFSHSVIAFSLSSITGS
jgi:hypothetical protein